jgi:hypothetical protein
MLIAFNCGHVFRPDASKVDNALALRALLDCLVDLNVAYLKHHPALGLYQSGVFYKRTLEWEPIPALYERGYGDCKSLATALIAQYRLQGIAAEPVFRFMPPFNAGKVDEYTLFHILIQTDAGFEDPSKDLGMGWKELEPFYRTDGTVESWDSAGMHPLR